MSEATQRRLAAIVSADVAGYSRLMGADEVGTLAALQAHRAELIDPTIVEYGGRIVKTMGDGLLLEFPSVVNAVQCSIRMQKSIAARNANVSQDQRIEFRIGINLGDVIIDGDDIHGDGVNIAARLQEFAEPGGISVSRRVHEDVQDRLDASFEDVGEQALKNIARSVRVWRWVPTERSCATPPPTAADAPLPIIPSIAVLPFTNMSGDPEQEYFSDGIAEDIITDLSKISALFVIARNSSFSYKDRSLDARQVTSELGVTHLLEGSVRRAGNRVRITAQLVEGASGGHVWADRYDRNLDDIFAIQDEITLKIVEALKVNLNLDEQDRLGGAGAADIRAYDFALRGRNLLYRLTPDANAEAVKSFESSIELDSNYITAHWGLAVALFTAYTNGWNDASSETLERGLGLASAAVELDPADPQGHWALALALLWKRNLNRAIAEIDKAVALGPNNSEAHAIRGYILSFAGRPAEAIESLEQSLRLNPQHPDIWLHFLAHAHFVHADYGTAAALLNRRIRLKPETDISRVLLASCYGHMGLINEAQEKWAEVLQINPDYSVEQKARILPYRDAADWERFTDGLRKAGLPG